MTEQQKPKVVREPGMDSLGNRMWHVSWTEQPGLGRTVHVDATASAEELRAIAEMMEGGEMIELHQVWKEQANEAWGRSAPNAHNSAPIWYVAGFIDAREIAYRERHGLPRKGSRR